MELIKSRATAQILNSLVPPGPVLLSAGVQKPSLTTSQNQSALPGGKQIIWVTKGITVGRLLVVVSRIAGKVIMKKQGVTWASVHQLSPTSLC